MNRTTMTLSHLLRAAGAAVLAAACVLPAHAGSLASSASSAGSESSGSISDSIGASSNSSNHDRRVAAGAYRVIDIAQAPAKAGTLRMTLRALAGAPAAQFTLDLPERALAARPVARGELVRVDERVYGYEFAYADNRQPFFLALQDDWYRELRSQKVAI